MILLKLDNMDFYDDGVALVKSFFPRTEVTAKDSEDVTRVIEATVPSENLDKKDAHEWFKRNLYMQLSNMTGKVLPWGFLTGVRPSKLAVAMLEKGMADDEIMDFYVREHLVGDKKAKLALQIARKELDLLENIDYDKGYSLYVGIPFCPTTCLYCSFTSYPLGMWEKEVDRYLDALIKELDYISELTKGRKLDTIYFGGGTPTTLSPQQLDRLLTAVEERFPVAEAIEYTVEAGRPDSITRQKLDVIKSHNVGRISINPQTMNQSTLDLIGRRHTVEQVKDAFNMAREAGFDNINMDIILALPNEGINEVNTTLEEITALAPESLTVHCLAIKRAAALNIWKDKYRELDLNTSDEIVANTSECAKGLGMEPYYMYRQKNMAGNFENVGYSRPGMECIYNILIMEEKQTIIAAGAGASTKVVYNKENRIERIENVKSVRDYIDRIDEMIERKRKYFAESDF